MSDKLKSLQAFRFKDKDAEKVVANSEKIQKRVKPTSNTYPEQYKDVRPSLVENLTLLFIGFNPGMESSLQQHHYAHFSNLFWKLFNQSGLLLQCLGVLDPQYLSHNYDNDELLQVLVKDGTTYAKPEHDYELIKYKIGFTDLILRCTRTAQELPMAEKLANVPRLIDEFNMSSSKHIVFIGKGIWEVIVKYVEVELGIKKVKLSKETFMWGLQDSQNSRLYALVLKKFQSKISADSKVFVFPNTSGLVGSLKYEEKLKLWQDLADVISKT
ncbi:predicted protein [Scheffersomyces stipitis CBS 6054]|uniref:Uracil-DNA glycosylase-like domain-containing protein n=1 Tax=Scheffersomyces stipitis (strain ATCC 58785 / CBS 6054 / NBRC 10063 / NRRL Y-11545) TaxID=322104 RepID=A3LQ36_PICST|nr:predicted protein [Scheffersomyces stipitis CBS 6054]ABN64607.2 predicted protein [Scheffersomyces stipitis CBS 6054]